MVGDVQALQEQDDADHALLQDAANGLSPPSEVPLGSSDGTYRSPRITDELRERGEVVNYKTVAAIMAEIGIRRFSRRNRAPSAVPAPPARPETARDVGKSGRYQDWLLYRKDCPAAGDVRGLAEGRIFHRDGTLIATVAQEGLIHSDRS